MRTSIIVFVAALGLADAAVNVLSPLGVSKRQDGAFDPDEETAQGDSCVEAFGEGSVECRPPSATQNRLCIEPALGHTCCENSWGCPGGSFCLVQDLCCPDGLDPETCAEQNGVDLPPNFSTVPTDVPQDTATAEPTASEVPSTSIPDDDTATVEPTASVPPTTTTADGGSGTTTPTAATSDPVVTAAAHHERAGVAAAVLGLAAAIVL
jgi:hypothetical protein